MSEVSKNEKDEQKKKKKTGIIIGLCILIVVLLLVIILLLIFLKKPKEENNRSSVRVVTDEESAATVMEDMREEVAKGMFECQMAMTWNFEDGKSPSTDAYVANSTNNKYPIYFDVVLNDTEETIYSSPVLPVGTNVANFALDKELPAGTYDATVLYTLLEDEVDQVPFSSAGFEITIKVLN